MAEVPKRVKERLVKGLKRFQPILDTARSRDVNEADTVTIIQDALADVFGYDKYSEITSEYVIRKTYCDLAIQVSGKILMLIEVKAIGIGLKDSHLRQVLNYGASEGCEWIALTNGIEWQVYRITYAKPIDKELVLEFSFLDLNPRNNADIESLFLLSREGRTKSALKDFHAQRQAANRHLIGAIILSEPVLKLIRRELRSFYPNISIKTSDIHSVIYEKVLKREVVEGDKAKEARKKVSKLSVKKTKKKATKRSADSLEKNNTLIEPETPTSDVANGEMER